MVCLKGRFHKLKFILYLALNVRGSIMKSVVLCFISLFFISASLPAQGKFEIGINTGPGFLNNHFALSSQINLLYNFNNNFSTIMNFEHLACKERQREIMLLSKMRYKITVQKLNPYFEFGLGISHFPDGKEILTNGSIQESEVNDATTIGTGGYSPSLEIGTGVIIPINRTFYMDSNLSVFQTKFSNYFRLGFGLLYNFR